MANESLLLKGYEFEHGGICGDDDHGIDTDLRSELQCLIEAGCYRCRHAAGVLGDFGSHSPEQQKSERNRYCSRRDHPAQNAQKAEVFGVLRFNESGSGILVERAKKRAPYVC